jgi:arabinofuranosyltransferase
VSANVGMFGFAASREVQVVDLHGLGDPLAARLRLVRRDRAGHEKLLPNEWVVARFADPARASAPVVTSAATAAAERALACGDLARLLQAIREPMSFGRAISNIGFSFTATTLRFSAEPSTAASELCR